MSIQPTPEQVRAFWQHMNRRFGARVIAKDNAAEMRAVAWALERMGVIDPRTFMERFATTIGHRIYVPFTVGVESGRWDLWRQMAVCVHEHQHIVQLEQEGAVRYSWQYMRSDSARAQFEADARTCNLEIHFWRYGKLARPEQWVESLEHYALGKGHVDLARTILEARAETIARGGLITRAGKTAVAWLNAYAPELKLAKA